MKLKTKDIAVTSLFVAIIAIMTFTPFGMIPLPMVKVAVVLIPLVVCAILSSFQIGLIVSIIFGILSMVNNYVNPTGILWFAFQNPLISVLPRIFIGPLVYITYNGMKKLLKVNNKELFASKLDRGNVAMVRARRYNTLSATVASIVGVTVNTLGSMTMLLIVYGGTALENGSAVGLALVSGIIVTNFIPEVIAAAIICPLIATGVQRAVK